MEHLQRLLRMCIKPRLKGMKECMGNMQLKEGFANAELSVKHIMAEDIAFEPLLPNWL